MAELVKLKSFTDNRGTLHSVQDQLGFTIKRVFYITNIPGNITRGKHSHLKTLTGLICLNGSCDIIVKSSNMDSHKFRLTKPNQCLILQPKEWREMLNFSENAVLLAVASTQYDPKDYVNEEPL